MKNIIIRALPVLAGLAFIVPSLKAQNYNTDDLIVNVRSTEAGYTTTDVLIDLGPAEQFFNGGTYDIAGVQSLGNYGTVLTAAFGSDWASSTTEWSIVGWAGGGSESEGNGDGSTINGDYINTLYASNAETTAGTQSPRVVAQGSNGAQASPGALINNVGTSVNGSTLPSGVTMSGSNAYIESGAARQYNTYVSGGTEFSYFPSNLENSFAAGTGAGGSTLDLYSIAPNTGNPGTNDATPPAGASFYVGAFNFASDGTLNFDENPTAFAAVPEPSTYALVGLGSIFMMLWMRRGKREAALIA